VANPRGSRSRSAKEPVQVYLVGDDLDLLARLAAETGLSKAEILRRGVRSFAREQEAPSPMLRFLEESAAEPAEGPPIAARHDEILAEEHAVRRRRRT
jgi:hypothetical protein